MSNQPQDKKEMNATGNSSITAGKDASNSGTNANPAKPATEANAQPKAGEMKPASTDSKVPAAAGSDKKSAA